MVNRYVHARTVSYLTTLFSWSSLTERLSSILAYAFASTTLLESVEGIRMTIEIIS